MSIVAKEFIIVLATICFFVIPTTDAQMLDPATELRPSLTLEQAQDLLYMWEEEKLARDVYEFLHSAYSHRVFNNISQAEQRHMNHVAGLLQTYGVNAVINPEQRGRFSIPEIQELYDQFITNGLSSLRDAFLVGQQIEIMDIADLEARLASETKADIREVYQLLLSGSQRHLAAFERQLQRF